MKMLFLLVGMFVLSFWVQAGQPTIQINNMSPCPFYMAVLNDPGPGSVATFPVAPSGVTSFSAGSFAGVALSTNPNGLGQNDGGMFIDPALGMLPIGNPWHGFPSSGSFLVVGCGMVTVNVYVMGGILFVDIM